MNASEQHGPFEPPPSPREGDLSPVADGYERAEPGTAEAIRRAAIGHYSDGNESGTGAGTDGQLHLSGDRMVAGDW